MVFVKAPETLECYRCGHVWVPRASGKVVKGKIEVRICPACKSPYWDRPREEGK